MTFFEWFYKAVIIEGVCIALILLSILAMKYFFKPEYKEVQDFYRKSVTVDTDVNEVLKGEI